MFHMNSLTESLWVLAWDLYLQELIVSELINSGVIKFYQRYVDDTLVLIEPSDIPSVFRQI